jgi:acetyl-CoA acyltransferase 2
MKEEIAPVEIQKKKTVELFSSDECPRPSTNLDALKKLNPVFKKGGVVTAGNASGISDGAGAIIVASEAAVHKYGLSPLARIVSYHVTGVLPSMMGIG